MRLVLSFALLGALFVAVALPAAADTIPYQVQIDWFAGPLATTQSLGGGTYDDTLLTGTGAESVNPANNGLTFGIVVAGVTFDETDDVGYSGFPQLFLLDAVVVGIDFLATNLVIQTSGALYIATLGDSEGLVSFPTNGNGNGQEPIPEPASILLLGGALTFAGVRRRRRRKKATS